MKKIFAFITAVTLSISALAGNISQDMDKKSFENIVNNEKFQRLHAEMTRYSFSESGMEARLQMMSKEGRAYHSALESMEVQKKASLSDS